MDTGRVFDSIESAQGFVGLLSETVSEAKKDVDAEVEKALDSQSGRRLQALRMVSYNLEKLAVHMKKSCRILNDLRSLRRLLFEERAWAKKPAKTAAIAAVAPKAGAVAAKPALPIPIASTVTSGSRRPSAGPRTTAVA